MKDAYTILTVNPGSTGTIINNVVYNTRGYVVDQATFLFSGNSWGLPANAVDIALLSGTTSGAPYDPISSLEANNSGATISDRKSCRRLLETIIVIDKCSAFAYSITVHRRVSSQ